MNIPCGTDTKERKMPKLTKDRVVQKVGAFPKKNPVDLSVCGPMFSAAFACLLKHLRTNTVPITFLASRKVILIGYTTLQICEIGGVWGSSMESMGMGHRSLWGTTMLPKISFHTNELPQINKKGWPLKKKMRLGWPPSSFQDFESSEAFEA